MPLCDVAGQAAMMGNEIARRLGQIEPRRRWQAREAA
jgi:hypothetical protein